MAPSMFDGDSCCRPTTGGKTVNSSRIWRAAPALLASCLLLAACGLVPGGDDNAATSATTVAPTATTLASAEPAAVETEPAETEEAAVAEESVEEEAVEEERTGPLLDDEGNPIEVLHPEAMPVPVLQPLNAGPIQFVPTLCEVNGVDMFSFDGIKDFVSAGDRFFFSGDFGVVALVQDEGSGPGGACSLTADESMGPGGVMLNENAYDRLSSTPEGRVVVSGVFGSYVFDTHLNQSFVCDAMGGEVRISGDGATGYSTWVSPEVEVWAISDSICTQGETVEYPDLEQIVGMATIGQDVFIDGRFDGGTAVTKFSNGAPQWTLGDGEPSEPDWWGPIEGVVPCGDDVCLTEFFGTLNVIDPNGVLVANFDGADATGTRGFYDIAAGSDGATYVVAADLFDHEFDGRTWFNWIIRLDRVG